MSKIASRHGFRHLIFIAFVFLMGCEKQDYSPVSYQGDVAEIYMGRDFSRTIRVPIESIEYISRRNPEYVDRLIVRLDYTVLDISQEERISTGHHASNDRFLKVTIAPTLKGEKYSSYGKDGEETFWGYQKEKSLHGLQLYSAPEDEHGVRYMGDTVKLRPNGRKVSDTFIISCLTREDNKMYLCRYNGVYDETLTMEASFPISYLEWWPKIDIGLRAQIGQWVH